MGQVSVIEQAIKSAESGTRTSDAQVTDILRGAGESGAAPPRYAQLLSAAQALLTGDADLALIGGWKSPRMQAGGPGSKACLSPTRCC